VIVFWTKNPAPLLPCLDELDHLGLRYYFQFTLNDYPRLIEPGMPDLAERLDTFARLAARVGKERVIWRYDPVLLTAGTDWRYHRERFAALVDRLAPSTGRVIVSIADHYRGAAQRLAGLAAQGYPVLELARFDLEYPRLFGEMAERAVKAGLEIYSCAEPVDLQPLGIRPGKCIDADYLRRVFGITVAAKKDRSQRPECGCVASQDIGAYDSCVHDCVYCYATRNQRTARRNFQNHRPEATSLRGER
jgi:DNA repair photolyase